MNRCTHCGLNPLVDDTGQQTHNTIVIIYEEQP